MKNKLISLAVLNFLLMSFLAQASPALATEPSIITVTPSFGPVGTRVTVTSDVTSFFTPSNNSINFAGVRNAITNLSVQETNPPSLSFNIPGTPCGPTQVCAQVVIAPGTYPISVTNGNGVTSNEVMFRVTGDPVVESRTGTVKIAVVDKTTGNNLLTRVEIRNLENNTVIASQDTTGGSAIFTSLPFGAYTALATIEGYNQVERAIFRIANAFNESVIIFMATRDVLGPIPPTPPRPPIDICPFNQFPVLKPGLRDDKVKKLQEILGVSQTGYYGPVTSSRVQDAERRAGLPVDGIVSESDRSLFFPCLQIAVTSPQNGENWKAGTAYTIKWLIERPVYVRPLGAVRIEERRDDVAQLPPPPLTVAPAPMPVITPVAATLSLDLVRFGGLVYHITDVTLTSDGSFEWQIPQSIASGEYQIRVGLGETPVLFRQQDLQNRVYLPEWRGWLWGESGTFTVTNETLPPPPNPQFKLQLQQLLQLVEQMQRLLTAMLSNL